MSNFFRTVSFVALLAGSLAMGNAAATVVTLDSFVSPTSPGPLVDNSFDFAAESSQQNQALLGLNSLLGSRYTQVNATNGVDGTDEVSLFIGSGLFSFGSATAGGNAAWEGTVGGAGGITDAMSFFATFSRIGGGVEDVSIVFIENHQSIGNFTIKDGETLTLSANFLSALASGATFGFEIDSSYTPGATITAGNLGLSLRDNIQIPEPATAGLALLALALMGRWQKTKPKSLG